MYSKTDYFENMNNQSEMALKKHTKTKEDLREYIEIIRKWIESQPHLPEIPNDSLIGNFLFMNKFSIEGTKQRLDMYYTKQSLIPEFFQDNNPDLPLIRSSFETFYYFPIPRSTDEGHRITIFKLIDPNPDNFNENLFFAQLFNTFEVRLHEDFFVGEILVYDFRDVSLHHIVKMTPTLIKKSTTVLEKVFNNSVHQIHIVNYPPFADTLIRMAKQIMKQKLVKRLHLHQGMDKIADFVPVKFLPKEFGGEERSLKELHELWKLKVADYRKRFADLSKLKVDEAKRPTPLINDDLLGFHGNFKKLNVD
ncbi:unnamed protein product [Phaedon cochleariae]|uniref:CRAL-TRIO domain-containing protein n=1 Tax=Phaedon cochleariae TaxID=80249 RepID=A0A9P0DSX5_PHACE|nr:unnamed protein product [Phaedon cochleariae]